MNMGRGNKVKVSGVVRLCQQPRRAEAREGRAIRRPGVVDGRLVLTQAENGHKTNSVV